MSASTVECYNCHEVGHIARACPTAEKNDSDTTKAYIDKVRRRVIILKRPKIGTFAPNSGIFVLSQWWLNTKCIGKFIHCRW